MKQPAYLALMVAFAPICVVAQEREPGGAYIDYGVDQRFLLSRADDPEDNQETRFEAVTGLQYTVVTETRTQSMVFDFGADLYLSDGSVIVGSGDVAVDYQRFSADALLDMSVRSNRSDIEYLRNVANFISDDGVLALPGDFEDFSGDGWRYLTDFSATITWGETAPIGYALSLDHSILRYEEAEDDLSPSEGTSLGAGIRLNLDAITMAMFDLSYDVFDEEGLDTERSFGLSSRVDFERPDGSLGFELGAIRDESGDVYWGGSVRRSYDIPIGEVVAALGMSEVDGGGVEPTGELSLDLELPRGTLDFAALFEIAPGDERTSASLQTAYDHELTPLSGMRISFDFAETSELDGSDPGGVRSASLAYTHQLTYAWSLSAGLRADRREAGGATQDSTSLFIGLVR